MYITWDKLLFLIWDNTCIVLKGSKEDISIYMYYNFKLEDNNVLNTLVE